MRGVMRNADAPGGNRGGAGDRPNPTTERPEVHSMISASGGRGNRRTDLTSRPGEPPFDDRVRGVQAAHRAGVAVPLGDAARQLGVRPGVLMRPGVARVRVQATWYTSPAEVERLRPILAGGRG